MLCKQHLEKRISSADGWDGKLGPWVHRKKKGCEHYAYPLYLAETSLLVSWSPNSALTAAGEAMLSDFIVELHIIPVG